MLLALGALSAPAAADETGPSLSVTETLIAERHGFNQDEQADNDDYEDVKSRLNLSLTQGAYSAALRIDDTIYVGPPTGEYADDQRIERVSLRADTRFASVTAGDFYVQFGRGIALALLKIDELGVDTTLRGARLDLHLPGSTETTLVAGTTNIVNIDDVNRRFAPDPADRIVGGRTETTIAQAVVVGAHTVALVPALPTRPEEGHDRIQNLGVDVGLPEIPGGFSLQAEGDLQFRRIGGADPTEGPQSEGAPDRSHQPSALYGSLAWTGGPLSLTVELKDYSDFRPLEGASDPFQHLAYTYSRPPTAERTEQQVPPQSDIWGGRLRADLRIPGTSHSVFANYAHSRTVGPDLSVRDHYETREVEVYQHLYAGGELRLNGDRTIVQANGGLRCADIADAFSMGSPLRCLTDHGNKQRLAHMDMDLTTPLFGPWGLHLSWVHESWRQAAVPRRILYDRGTAVVEVDFGSTLAVAGAFEYDTQFANHRTQFWFGDARWTVTPNLTLHAVVGTQRGGLKCVNGVCRTFPSFAGARAEAVIRY